jgi:hypothetical protein
LHFIVPREVTATSAIIWMAAVDEPAQPEPSLQPANIGAQTAGAWQSWPADGNIRVRHREVRITGLTAGQSYQFALRVGTRTVANCKLVTLPEKLPLLGERPFIMLLGTCFAQHEDSDGKVGNAFFHMPQSRSPDIKLLAGDQVYLDSPWWKYLMQHSNDSLRDSFLEKYTSTWGQADGFARLLADGANYFCSDDHEYWNNAPNAGTYVADTWGEEGRSWW